MIVFLKKICVSERKCVTLHPDIINILKKENYVRN